MSSRIPSNAFVTTPQPLNDTDLVRLGHLLYWTGLIEEYQRATGHYPFQDSLRQGEIVLVKIATQMQRRYLSPGSKEYRSAMDNNYDGSFEEHSMREFVLELERGLGRDLEERYDIQSVPRHSPIGYNYFATDSGYVFWVPCQDCRVTTISTLLLDGYTPTVNIASANMKERVTKALTREEMLTHPMFQGWIQQPLKDERAVRAAVARNAKDSKE